MFIADCPRGHRGCFIDMVNYDLCHCGLQVAKTVDKILFPESDNELQQQKRVTEQVVVDLQDRVNELTSNEFAPEQVQRLLDKLKEYDPNYPHNLPMIFLDQGNYTQKLKI